MIFWKTPYHIHISRISTLLVACLILALVFSSAMLSYAEDELNEETDAQVLEETSEEEIGEEETGDENSTEESDSAIRAGASLVYCTNTGESVFSTDADKKFSPYGVARLFTAYLAAQKLSISDEVTVSDAAVNQEGNKLGFQAGEIVSVEKLIYATLVYSANDAAFALAEAVSGSGDDFVVLMNETLESIGCKDTRFASPSGNINDISIQYTTANDMLQIVKLAMANETIRNISGVTEYEIINSESGESRNVETADPILLSEEAGYVAALSGIWDDDKSSCIALYDQGGLKLICVVLSSEKDNLLDNCNALVEYAKANIKGIDVAHEGDQVAKVRVKKGEITTIDGFLAQDCIAYLPKEGSEVLITEEVEVYSDLEAPVSKGDVVGKYRVFVAGELVNEVDIISHDDIGIGWLPSYVGISNRGTIIISSVILLVLLLIIVRTVNKIRMRHYRKKMRKQRILELARKMLEEENE